MGESNKDWERYFDSLEDVMLIVNRDYTIEKINKKGLVLLTKKPEEVVNSKCYELFFDKSEPCEFCPFKKSIQTKKPEIIECEDKIFDKYFSIKSFPIFNKNGEIVKFVGLMKDITQQKRTERRNRLLAAIVESSNDAIIGKSLEGTITSWNDGAEQIYGYTEQEMIGKNISVLFPKDRECELSEIFDKICSGEKINHFETVRQTKKGKKNPVSLTISPIKDERGQVIGASTIARDISKNKEIEQEKNQLIRSLNERVKELDCLYEVSKLVDDYENSLDSIFQSVVELIPSSWQFPEITCDRIVFDDKTFTSENFQETPWSLSSDIVISGEKRGCIQVCYSEERPNAWEGAFLKEERHLIDGVSRHLSVIADRKIREDQMKVALDEKETLLKEIHHRVKNNLQIISSMLKLQSDSIYKTNYLEKNRESQHRIQSIARVHEQLYKSDNLAEISVQEYVESLLQDIIPSYSSKSKSIKWECDCRNISLNITVAIPFALIINELASNACKHAFLDGEKGKIKIDLTEDNSQYKLIIRDNGKGISDSIKKETISSLGLELVVNLVKQIKGSINWYNDHGAVFEIRFKKK